MPDAPGAAAHFGDENALSGPTVVGVDGAFTVGSIVLDSDGMYDFAPAGATSRLTFASASEALVHVRQRSLGAPHHVRVPLTLEAPLRLQHDVSNAVLALYGPISGAANLIKSGPGSLDITGENAQWTGEFHVTGGHVLAVGENALGSASSPTIISAGSLFQAPNLEPFVVTGSGRLELANGTHENAITLGGGTLAGSHTSIIGSHATITLVQAVKLTGGSSTLAAKQLGNVVLMGGTAGTGDLTLRSDPTVTVRVDGPLAHVGRTTVSAGANVHFNVALALAGELRVDGQILSNADLNARGVRSDSEVGAGASTGTVVLAPGTSLTADHVRLGTLALGTGARIIVRENGGASGTSRTRSLSLGGTPDAPLARFELADNALVLDYSAGNSPLDATRRMITAARNGGAWDGNGIGSALGDAANFGIGYGESSELLPPGATDFVGQVIASRAVLARFTRYGDANLDAQVNLLDFNRLATSFGQSGRVWSQGDFNYDGNVNLADFNLLAANFGVSAAGAEVTPDDWATLAAAVPEPAMLASSAGVVLLLGRRSRRREICR